MLPDRVSNPGPQTYESDALPIALRGPALRYIVVSAASHYIRFVFKHDVFFHTSSSSVLKSLLEFV